MAPLSIRFGRILLHEFTEANRAAFIEYQTDPRYLRLYDFDGATERPSKLFDLFLQWQHEQPRLNLQVGVYDAAMAADRPIASISRSGAGLIAFSRGVLST